MKQAILKSALIAAVLVNAVPISGFETDQYNLPPVPLADIGSEVAAYTEENLRGAIARLNASIAQLEACRNGSGKSKCPGLPEMASRLAYLRSEEAAAREVFKRLGDGFIASTKAGSWMDSHTFRAQPARYKTRFGRSIFVYIPTNYFTISPTVKLYGRSLGTDKVAHLFQQGYTYYRIKQRARARGMDDAAAVRRAVGWGTMSERTFYGTLVSGVYSNADLAANFAGMKFYEGLFRPVDINGTHRPAAFILENGSWKINPAMDNGMLLAPFISDHMNEALNPSLYVPGLRSAIRGIVKKQSCPAWRAAFGPDGKAELENITAPLNLWFGEDYGHKPSRKFIAIADTCFGDGDGPTSLSAH